MMGAYMRYFILRKIEYYIDVSRIFCGGTAERKHKLSPNSFFPSAVFA